MTGVWRCPRCAFLRTMLVEIGPGVVAIDERRQRIVCPVEGATLVPVSDADIAAFGACAAEGHVAEAWRGGACECGTRRA